MLSIPFTVIGIVFLGVAAYFCYKFWKNWRSPANMLMRMPYRDAAQMATLFFLAAITAKILGW